MFKNSFFKKISKVNPKNQFKRNKPYTQNISPLNYSFESNKNKDHIINNYNVKVNITKKKTKNISIGNITVNNNSNKNINKSPFNLDLDKITYESKKLRKRGKEKFKSAFDSPNKSLNKIILNLKNEFEEIKNKTRSNSQQKQKEDKKNNSNTSINKESINNNKPIKSNIQFHSINNSKLHKLKRINNNNSLSLEKIGENSKNTMEINRINNFIFKPFLKKNLQKINFKTEPKGEDKSIKSCYINQLNLSKDDKSLLYYAKSSLYSFRQSPTISFSYITNKKNKYKKEDLIDKLYNEIKEYKLIIPLLIQYIKIQSKIFMENSYKKNEEYAKKEYLKEIELLKETNQYLIEQNNKYKRIILNMMCYLEKDYSSSIINQKKISEIISQILKENDYLREVSKSTLNINKEIITTNVSLTSLKTSIDNSNAFMKRIQINEDIFSKLLVKDNLELTCKKEEKKRDSSIIKKKFEYNFPKKRKDIEIFLKNKMFKLSYLKKKN